MFGDHAPGWHNITALDAGLVGVHLMDPLTAGGLMVDAFASSCARSFQCSHGVLPQLYFCY
jgi:hypothetical protein